MIIPKRTWLFSTKRIVMHQPSADAQTLKNIQAARTLPNRPPEDYLVSYASIADLWAKQAAKAPDTIFLIHYDANGARTAFTYADFDKQINKAANACRNSDLIFCLLEDRGDGCPPKHHRR
jgi:hypothetical protein